MPVTWKEDTIAFDLQADDLSEAAAQSIADGARKRIPQGQLSDGSGAQEPPKRGDTNGIRGYDNGRLFAKRIKANRIAGGKRKAEYMATLKLNPGKIADRVYAWLEREQADGVEYIHAPASGSPGDREMEAAIAKVLDEAVK